MRDQPVDITVVVLVTVAEREGRVLMAVQAEQPDALARRVRGQTLPGPVVREERVVRAEDDRAERPPLVRAAAATRAARGTAPLAMLAVAGTAAAKRERDELD